jgi:hypothetical protein
MPASNLVACLRRLVLVAALLVLGGTSWGQEYSHKAYEAGRADAEKDLRNNVLAIERFGLPAVWDPEYSAILQEKYHIVVRPVAGCVVNADIIGHARGYNEVSRAEIERRFGADVFEKARKEAVKRHQEKSGR